MQWGCCGAETALLLRLLLLLLLVLVVEEEAAEALLASGWMLTWHARSSSLAASRCAVMRSSRWCLWWGLLQDAVPADVLLCSLVLSSDQQQAAAGWGIAVARNAAARDAQIGTSGRNGCCTTVEAKSRVWKLPAWRGFLAYVEDMMYIWLSNHLNHIW